MRKIFTLFAATLFAWAASATPQTDFSSSLVLAGADAEIAGNIEKWGDNNYLLQKNNGDPTQHGTATWVFELTDDNVFSASIVLNIDTFTSGHIYKVEIFDALDNLVGSSVETKDTKWSHPIDVTLPDAFILNGAGTYKVVLSDTLDWSGSCMKSLTLSGAKIPSTDFAGAGFACTADNAVLSGTASASKFYLQSASDPHYIGWNDVSYGIAVAKWTINATRACLIAVSLDLGPKVSSNKHIFEVQVLNSDGDLQGALAEGEADPNGDTNGYQEENQVKTLDGTIVIPEAGIYTIELRNIRGWGKGSIKNVILTARPQVQLIGTMNNWSGEDLFQLAEDGKTSSLKLNLEPNSDTGYAFKLNVGDAPNINTLSINNGTDKYGFNRGNTSAKVNYVSATSEPMWIVVDLAGEYTFTWTFADSTLAITYPEPKLANGYYLMGVINGAAATWKIDDLDEDRLLVINPDKEAEYIITTELAVGDELQVVSVVLDEIKHWYPGGEGNNYVVDAAHAGENKTIYFRPDRLGDEAWWHGCIFIDANATAIDQTTSDQRQTTKSIVNGQLLIIRDGKTYNVLGTEIR